MKKPKLIARSGDLQQHVDFVYQQYIAPIHAQIAQVDQQSAYQFAYKIAGATVSGFLIESPDLVQARDILLKTIDGLIVEIETDRKAYAIMAKPQGSA